MSSEFGSIRSVCNRLAINSLRNNKRDGVIQSAPPGHPATFGASYRFCPIVANRFGMVGHHWGSTPVVLIVPISKSIGDFIISYYKRVAKVKDSGKLIPGHGGILDRMDAFLITIPVFYILINLR